VGQISIVGRCPIHRGEGRDAFHVNLARNIFHCFACGAGGTVLEFVAAMEGCTLREVVEKLQPRAWPIHGPGVSLPWKELVTEKRRALYQSRTDFSTISPNQGRSGTERDAPMKIVAIIARILLGLMFVVFGLIRF